MKPSSNLLDVFSSQLEDSWFTVLLNFLCSYSFDELLVSAPLFRANSTEPETGRVYIYRNTGVCIVSHLGFSSSLILLLGFDFI